MLRTQPVQSLISLAQLQSVYYSSGLTKKQILRIRADQKELYGHIIRGNTKRFTESVRKKAEGVEEKETESIASKTADFKPSSPSKTSEFYWLIQRGDNRNVRIIRSKDVIIGDDEYKFDESSSSNKTS